MIRDLILAGIGGGLGSMLRLGMNIMIKPIHMFPIATFSVNCIGSFLIGIFAGLALRENQPGWHVFFATGICGGFTTFSAFSLEGLQMIQQQKTGIYLLYAFSSILLGLGFAWLGWKIVR
jgi:CrcB protein